MKLKIRFLLSFGLIVLVGLSPLVSQAAPLNDVTVPAPLTPTVGYAMRADVSPALRDMPVIAHGTQSADMPETNLPLPKALSWDAAESLDPVLQRVTGPLAMPDPLTSFDGVNNVNGVHPPDTQGDIGYDPATGTKYYVQWVNLSFAIWDVTNTPAQIYGPVNGNTLWQGFGGVCETTNHGDPITLYDTMANRWLMSQFSVNGPYYQCIAISQTADPTGPWYRYAFMVSSNKMNDYPHFGVWPDGYYMTVNQFTNGSSWGGAGVFVFERDKMLAGDPTASFQSFDLYSVDPNFGGMLPSDLDGATLPPAGAPNYFLEVDDSPDELSLWEFHVDWQNSANSTFGINGQPNAVLPTAAFTPLCAGTRACIPQQGTTARLDAIGDRLMYRVAYRNYGTHESLVLNHTVNAGSNVAGVRWYEVRNPGGTPVIYQQGTYSPDSHSRWMASVAMDAVGNMAVGYSVSSSSMYPSIRYAGRTGADPLGTLPQAEASLVEGTGYQTSSYSRWGDYSMMSIDPVDDCTFWFTEEYMETSGYSPWSTRIGSFRFPNCSAAEPGTLAGVVSDGGTGHGIAGAEVSASDGSGLPQTTLTGANGAYALTLDAGPYTVTVGAYGYNPDVTTGVAVVAEQTTVHNVSLTPAPSYVVSGTVADAQTGWPLYARISVTGSPFSPPLPDNETWTEPATGFYSLTLASGITYTLDVDAWAAGYVPGSAVVTPLVTDETVDFALHADLTTCNAPGYVAARSGAEVSFDTGTLPAGWTLVDAAGDGVDWRFDDPGDRSNLTGGSGAFAIIDSDDAGVQDVDAALQSPSFNFSGDSAVMVQFKYDFRWYTYGQSEVADVDVSTDGGSTWTNVWRRSGGSDRGPKMATVDISSLAAHESDVRVRFRYYNALYEWWWQVDDVFIGTLSCTPGTGGVIVGEVFDANTSEAVAASIANDAGFSTTASTVDAPGTGAFYTVYAPSGSSVLTATAPSYTPSVESVVVTGGAAVVQDLYLDAGMLTVAPAGVAMTLTADVSATVPLTLSNVGGVDAGFEVQEVAAPYVPPSVTGPFAGMVRRVSPKHLHDLDATTVRECDPPDVPLLPAGTAVQSWATGLAAPWGIAYDEDAGVLWVGDTKFGGGMDANVAYVPDGTPAGATLLTSPWVEVFGADIAYNGVTGRLWQVNVGGDNCLYEMAPGAQTATGRTICPPFGVSARGLAYDPATDTFYSGAWSDQVLYHFDADGRLLDSVDLRLNIAGLAFNPATGHLFVMSNAEIGRDVYVVDTAAGYTIIGGFDIAGLGAYEQAGMTLDCSGTLWVVNQSTGQVIEVISGETGVCAWEEIAWLSTDPMSGTVPVGQNASVSMLVDTTGMAPGAYPVHLRIANDTPYGELSVPVTLTVIAPYSVTVVPESAAQSGAPGDLVTYTLAVTNTGLAADTFTVTVSGAGWTTVAPAAVGPLASGASASLTVTVAVPAGAACAASDAATVTVTSQAAPDVMDVAVLTTSADSVAAVVAVPVAVSLAADPGTQVGTSVWITNAGNCVDTFAVDVANVWPVAVPATTGALDAGAGVAVPVTVTVPGGAPAGAYDVAALTATSQADATAYATSHVTTTANAVYAAVLSPEAASAGGNVGEAVVYLLDLTNAGNITDTYVLTVEGAAWPVTVMPEGVTLAPDATTTVTTTVAIPLETSATDDVVHVIATGSDVLASSVLTTTLDCVPVRDAGFTYVPPSPVTGQVVTFTGSVVAGTLPLTYTWDFGDGSAIATGAVVTHTYTTGTAVMPYAVVMTATNACSADVATGLVTVQPHTIFLPLVLKAN